MLLNKLIDVKIHGRNRERYEAIVGKNLSIDDIIQVRQDQIPKNSRIMVECQCDYCGSIFKKRMVDVHTLTFCNRKCRGNHLALNNPNPSKDKVKVNCSVCSKTIEVVESKYKKQKDFLCSRECYARH